MENQKTAHHQSHRALVLIRSRPDLFSRQGYLAALWRASSDRRTAYYSLRFRQDGRLSSIYLGRAGPLVEEVRTLLAALQQPFRATRAYRQWRRRFLAVIRSQKVLLNAGLRARGLRLKGLEIRGWKGLRLPQ